MNTSNENGLNRASKAGIINWALGSDRKIVILLIAFGLALDSTNWFFFLTGTLPILGIQQIIYALFMFSLCFQRNKYIDLIIHFEYNAKLPSNDQSLDAYMKRNRYFFYLITFINFLINAAMNIVPFIMGLIKLNMSALRAFVFSSLQISFFCNFALFRFFVETCLYIHTCFMRVEKQIDTLNKSTNGLSIEHIRKVRRLYCIAVETTEKFNSLLWPVISTYFVFSFVSVHFIFAKAIADASFVTILVCAGYLSVFILVAYNMVYINHLATRIYQSAYSLSYKTDLLFAKKEVQLFLTRIERSDVGFTFLDLFVITPTCATTLATISLTLALAAPFLIK
uniref:Gustatory receptor n=1 Tax=Tetranychus urticae TaxID=32264 RepID=T1KCM4_TETUR